MRGLASLFAVGVAAAAVAGAALVLHRTPAAAAPRGHGAITEQLDCSACHTPAGWRTLVEGDPGSGFDHDRTGFPLRGQHVHTPCTQCHVAGRVVTRRCNGCHADAHRGRLAADCSQCHNAGSWLRTDAIERHRMTRLPLSGMHALADCVDCHRRSADRTWSAVPADCFACHADDYRRSDVHPVHVGSADGSSPPFDRNCGACHRATGWAPAVIPLGGLAAASRAASPLLARARSHDLRFPIGFGAHRAAACGDCHARQDGRGPVQCTGCHAHSPTRLRAQHRGGLPATQAGACLACHPGGAAR